MNPARVAIVTVVALLIVVGGLSALRVGTTRLYPPSGSDVDAVGHTAAQRLDGVAHSSGDVPAEVAEPDPSVYQVELSPPALDQKPGENHVFTDKGNLEPGTPVTRRFVLPKMARMTALLMGEGVRYEFQSSDGTTIVPGETRNRSGFMSLGAQHGLYGFSLDRPDPGTWTITVAVTEDGGPTSYSIDIQSEGAAAENAHVETLLSNSTLRLSAFVHPGEPVYVRAFILGAGKPVAGVDWYIEALTPSDKKITIPVYDDGSHADGGAGDGVFVGAIVAEGPGGFYRIRASGRSPSGAELLVTEMLEVRTGSEAGVADPAGSPTVSSAADSLR